MLRARRLMDLIERADTEHNGPNQTRRRLDLNCRTRPARRRARVACSATSAEVSSRPGTGTTAPGSPEVLGDVLEGGAGRPPYVIASAHAIWPSKPGDAGFAATPGPAPECFPLQTPANLLA